MAKYTLVVLAIGLACVYQGMGAPTGTGNIERRDTDKVSALKAKLQKLHALLQELYEDDGPEASSAPQSSKQEATPTAEAAVSEDMQRSGEDKPGSTEEEEELDGLNEKVLARALTRLQSPVYTGPDSTGDYLTTEHNEDVSDVKSRNMERVIARALTRLENERSSGTLDQPPSQGRSSIVEGSFGRFADEYEAPKSQLKDSQIGLFHDEAVRIVELKLMRDVQAARQIGVSVEEIIDDLQGKAYKEAEIKEVERELQELTRYRHE